MNVQRMVIYEQRRKVLEGDDMSSDIGDWMDEVIERAVLQHTEGGDVSDWDVDSLFAEMAGLYETEIQPGRARPGGDDFARSWSRSSRTTPRDAYEAEEEIARVEPCVRSSDIWSVQWSDRRWRRAS